jgi:hypothetical protein
MASHEGRKEFTFLLSLSIQPITIGIETFSLKDSLEVA